MQINDEWKIADGPSSLKLKVVPGKNLDHLHIESLDGKMNRDFWFTKEGKFDGTGTDLKTRAAAWKGER